MAGNAETDAEEGAIGRKVMVTQGPLAGTVGEIIASHAESGFLRLTLRIESVNPTSDRESADRSAWKSESPD